MVKFSHTFQIYDGKASSILLGEVFRKSLNQLSAVLRSLLTLLLTFDYHAPNLIISRDDDAV